MATPYTYLPDRAVLALTGPDTIALLERLVTHSTANWTPGENRYGALLTPQGKIIADYLALRTALGVLLDVASNALADLHKRLTLFRLRADVTLTPRDDLFVIAGTDPADHGPRPISGTAHVLVDPRYLGGRLRAFATQDEWQGWHGGHPAESTRPLPDYHADRIANAVGEWGSDFAAAQVFPADINMDKMTGVDLQKGCFVGQEVVSRMHRRGNIRRRTVALTSTGSGSGTGSGIDLTPGTPIQAETPIGEITSVEGPRALARIRIDRLARADSNALTVNGAPVQLHIPDWLAAEMAALSADG
ncbi:MAG: folate-binding protein [Pseudomonadota bacterium]